jgi:hypothetical protein
MHDGSGYGDTLTLSAREQVGALLRTCRETDTLKGFGDTLSAFSRTDALDE